MLAELPKKYYLHHAKELFAHVRNHNAHLIDVATASYLDAFDSLAENAQCLLVRCLARKPLLLQQSSLNYEEIKAPQEALQACIDIKLLSRPLPRDWPNLIETLSKAQLSELLIQRGIGSLSTMNKGELLALAKTHVKFEHGQALAHTFVARRQKRVVDYLFFLFFGNLNNQFQKFVMRDLGVLKTQQSSLVKPRFESYEQAQSCFELHCVLRELKQTDIHHLPGLIQTTLAHQAVGVAALECRDQALLKLGEKQLALGENAKVDSQTAINLWRQSGHPKALELRIRQQYKYGHKADLQQELEHLQNQTLEPTAQIFVADFYQRKFIGKRTSVYTDIMRQNDRVVSLDEVFINNAEQGLLEHYRQFGLEAFFTENQFWRVLFGLSLWPILWGDSRSQHSEFDRLPIRLRDGDFYSKHRDEIERELAAFSDPRHLNKQLARRAAQFYGQSNGVFRWRAGMLDAINQALQCTNAPQLASVVREMAKQYRYAKDGYPDLLVIEQNEFRFEEVKAPGDQLRPNQLVALQRLRNADISAQITQLEWAVNPEQSYSVVDIETTGGRRGGNAITEIAVVTLRNQEVIREWSTLLNPGRPIPRHITQLTGIDNSMVADAPSFAEVADDLDKELNGSIFVAHNVGFDYGFIQAAYENIGRRFKRPKCCTVRMARKAFPGLKSYSLGALSEHFDIDLNGHHRALNDARATANLLRLIHDAR